MDKSQARILYNVPAVIIIGIVLQIGGTYLVNALCVGVPMLGDRVPSFILREIESYSSTITDLTSMEPKMVMYVIFAAPLIEEIVFRVMFLMSFLKLLPFWVANILQALLFGLYHRAWIQGGYAFLMGLVIGAVLYSVKMQLGNSMIAPLGGFLFSLLLHVTINTSGLYLAPLLPPDLSIPQQVIIGLVCVVAVTTMILLFMKIPVKRDDRTISEKLFK